MVHHKVYVMSKYLTFPILILKGCTKNLKNSINEVMTYMLYSTSMKMDGNQEERLEKAMKVICIKFGDAKKSGALPLTHFPDYRRTSAALFTTSGVHLSLQLECPRVAVALHVVPQTAAPCTQGDFEGFDY